MCDNRKKDPYRSAKEEFEKSKETMQESLDRGKTLCERLKRMLEINLTPAG